MMNSRFTRSLAVAVSLLFVVGCTGKPTGFPKVSPCEVLVVDDGNPIADVDVALIPDVAMSGVVVGGFTDESGKCVVKTTFANFSANGAPSGSFTVILKKDPEPADYPELTADQMSEMKRPELEKYYAERAATIKKMPQIIPFKLTSEQTSPIKIVLPDAKSTSIDVSQHKD